jgi:hypothetical protein
LELIKLEMSLSNDEINKLKRMFAAERHAIHQLIPFASALFYETEFSNYAALKTKY